jgi:hypothetical protein
MTVARLPVGRADCMEERVTITFLVAGWRAPWFRKTFTDSLRAMG